MLFVKYNCIFIPDSFKKLLFFLTFTLCYTLDPWNFKNLSPYVTLWNPRGMYLTEPGTSFVTYYKLSTFLSVDMETLAPWSAAEGCTGYCRVSKSPYLRTGTQIPKLSPVIVKDKTFWTPPAHVNCDFFVFGKIRLKIWKFRVFFTRCRVLPLVEPYSWSK